MLLNLVEESRMANDLALAVDAMNTPILISLTPAQAACVVGQLQIALRHPGNCGGSANVARELAETLIGAFPPLARPALDQGWMG